VCVCVHIITVTTVDEHDDRRRVGFRRFTIRTDGVENGGSDTLLLVHGQLHFHGEMSSGSGRYISGVQRPPLTATLTSLAGIVIYVMNTANNYISNEQRRPVTFDRQYPMVCP